MKLLARETDSRNRFNESLILIVYSPLDYYDLWPGSLIKIPHPELLEYFDILC